MGMYDTVDIQCWHCKEDTYAQTKLSDEQSTTHLKIGDFFTESLGKKTVVLKLKDDCIHCGKENAIWIRHGLIAGVVDPAKATVREKPWGEHEFIDPVVSNTGKKNVTGFCPCCGVAHTTWLEDGHDEECMWFEDQPAGDYDSIRGVEWNQPPEE